MRDYRLSAFFRDRLLVPTTVFTLTCGLAACDLPGGASAKAGKAATAASQEQILAAESGVPTMLTSWSAASNQTQIAATPIEPLPVESVPPAVQDVEITPMEDPKNPELNALLSVRFRDGAELQDSIQLVVDRQKFQLVRDPDDKFRFTGMIQFDFDQFTREQEQRRALIESSRDAESVVFSGRTLAAREKFEFVEPAAIQAARAASTTLRLPRTTVSMPPSAVDPRRELLITDLSVVNDPTRTFDICGNVGNPNGAWTFKTLMTNMANQPLTGIDPALFVENWVQNWNVNHTINTFAVPARPNIGTLVLNSWPRLSNGRLNLDRSPFRLLAIVNRVDLRSNPVYGGGPGSAGEGRFVFGVVNRNAAGGCSVMPFTVIFEYGIPVSGCTATKNYAQQWVNLGNIALGSAAFNPALQAITDQFTTANAAPGKPNGSALNQLRTNENALNPLWELREFVLPPPNGMLAITTAKQTPHISRKNTALTANYINVNAAAILAGTHSVPLSWNNQPFLTGSSFAPSLADSAVWNAPGVGNQERHMFSMATCESCHTGEARDNIGGDTAFTHITTRLSGAQSNLSKFLVGTGTLAAPTTFNKPDPINGAPIRPLGDLLRRQQDLASLMNTTCRSTGLVHALRFERLRNVH